MPERRDTPPARKYLGNKRGTIRGRGKAPQDSEELAKALCTPPAEDDGLRTVMLVICRLCREGAGGECHTPGCAFWMCAAPDIPPSIKEVERA